jgi:hypothetical protein
MALMANPHAPPAAAQRVNSHKRIWPHQLCRTIQGVRTLGYNPALHIANQQSQLAKRGMYDLIGENRVTTQCAYTL